MASSSSRRHTGVTENPSASTSRAVALSEAPAELPANASEEIPFHPAMAVTGRSTWANLDRASGSNEALNPSVQYTSTASPEMLDNMRDLLGPKAVILGANDRDIQDLPFRGYIGIHCKSVLYGFRVPLRSFLTTFFHYFRILPRQLVPNSHHLHLLPDYHLPYRLSRPGVRKPSSLPIKSLL